MNDPRPQRDVELTRHAPERDGGGAPGVMPAGCCCCCCCLHSIGGVAGAIIGSATQMRQRPVYDDDPDAPFPYRRDVFEEDQPAIPPVMLFWLLVGLISAGTVAVTAVTAGMGPNGQMEGIAVGVFIVVMCLPAVLLGASFLATIAVAVFYPERGYALRRIGKITLWWIGGTAIGLLLMGGCYLALVGLK